MSIFKTIMVAHDGSDTAESALDYAVGLARESNAELVIAHVDQQTSGKAGNEGDIVTRLGRHAEALTTDGVHTTLRKLDSIASNPAYEIAAMAEEAGADVIVVGTRGHSPLGGMLVGSVTQRLIHIAEWPVITVPPGPRPGAPD